jgi:hypothetical protein
VAGDSVVKAPYKLKKKQTTDREIISFPEAGRTPGTNSIERESGCGCPVSNKPWG